MEEVLSKFPPARRGAWAIGLAIVAADMGTYAATGGASDHYAWRLLGAVTLVYVLVLARVAPPESFGLDWSRARADAIFAMKVGLGVCAVLAAVGVTALAAVRLSGLRFGIPPAAEFESMDRYYGWLLNACVMAPIVEEFIYRGLFVGLAASSGWRRGWILAASAAIFLGLHVVYGMGRDPVSWVQYSIAGALLAWVFCERRSLVPAVMLHAMGNLAVGVQNIVLLRYRDEVERLLFGP